MARQSREARLSCRLARVAVLRAKYYSTEKKNVCLEQPKVNKRLYVIAKSLLAEGLPHEQNYFSPCV